MPNKKYKLGESKQFGKFILHRIIALRDFGIVKAGDVGGWIESERNLSHEGDCWVFNNARVFGFAKVYEDCSVSDYSRVFGYAHAFGKSWISGTSRVSGHASVSGLRWLLNARLSKGKI